MPMISDAAVTSTQNQAFNALVFIYTHVLNRPGMAVKSPADF